MSDLETHPMGTRDEIERLTTEVSELTAEVAQREADRIAIAHIRDGKFREWNRENKRLTAEVTRLQTIANYARDFIDQYQIVVKSDEYKGIWPFLGIRNCEYKGPIFRDPGYLLAALDSDSDSQTTNEIPVTTNIGISDNCDHTPERHGDDYICVTCGELESEMSTDDSSQTTKFDVY